jgi:hypothetical protein
MNPIDQRLRAAMRDTAGEITPDGIPPLRLPPGQPGRRLRVVRAGGPPPWRSLAPLAAAAAVVAIVAAALALASGPPRPGPRPAVVSGSVPSYSGSVPPYYVALDVTGNGDCCRTGLPYSPVTEAVVRATGTGAVLATITPPRPYGTFIGVSGAAGDRTFVLAAVQLTPLPYAQAPPAGLFLLRIDPANPVPSARARLIPLPIMVQPPGAGVTGLALSPDGSKLAIAEAPIGAPPAIHVVTLATGAGRAWAATTGGPTFGPGTTGEPLSWAQDERTVAFVSAGTQVRLLNTAAAGDSLLASSRPVVSAPGLAPYWQQVMITPDGQTIIAVIQDNAGRQTRHGYTARQELVTFSARTGKLLHVLNRIPVYGNYDYEQVLWASPSGQVLIVSGTQPGATAGYPNLGATAGVLSQGRVAPIPWTNRTFAAAW